MARAWSASRSRRPERPGRVKALCGSPRAAAGSAHQAAVHLAEGVGEQLEASAVRVPEVQRRAADVLVCDAGLVEPAPQALPGLGVDADGDVVQPAEHLGVGAEVQPWEVEEGEEVAVADVEEEVVGASVVTVLEDVGERELEHPLVEPDGPLDVRGEQGDVVHAPGGRRRPPLARLEVGRAEALALGLDRLQVDAAGFGHWRLLSHGTAPTISPPRVAGAAASGRQARRPRASSGYPALAPPEPPAAPRGSFSPGQTSRSSWCQTGWSPE